MIGMDAMAYTVAAVSAVSAVTILIRPDLAEWVDLTEAALMGGGTILSIIAGWRDLAPFMAVLTAVFAYAWWRDRKNRRNCRRRVLAVLGDESRALIDALARRQREAVQSA